MRCAEQKFAGALVWEAMSTLHSGFRHAARCGCCRRYAASEVVIGGWHLEHCNLLWTDPISLYWVSQLVSCATDGTASLPVLQLSLLQPEPCSPSPA